MSKIPTYRVHSEPYKPPIGQLQHDITILRKRYGRGLGRIPTKDERAAMKRAAALTIIADYALTDPAATANDVVRLANAADRARTAMEALLEVGNQRSTAHDAFGIRQMVEG